jgi:hypothetical protein
VLIAAPFLLLTALEAAFDFAAAPYLSDVPSWRIFSSLSDTYSGCPLSLF